MNGFRTGRALVIDDNPAEAITIIKALSDLGIACFYANGQASETELQSRPKLEGVRLLVLDMVLNEAITDDRQCAALVVSQISGLIDHEHEPIVLVCWTNRQEMSGECYNAFKRRYPLCQCNTPIVFNKNDFVEHPDELVSRIDQELKRHEPITLLYNWEQRVHDSATTTTRFLSQLISKAHANFVAENSTVTWASSAFRVLAAMAIAEGGTRLAKSPNKDALSALYGCLNPLLLDRLEHSPIPDGVITDQVLEGLKRALLSEIPASPSYAQNVQIAPQNAASLSAEAPQTDLRQQSVQTAPEETRDQIVAEESSDVGVAALLEAPVGATPELDELAQLPTEVIARVNSMLLLASLPDALNCPGSLYLLNQPSDNLTTFKNSGVFDKEHLIKDTIVTERGDNAACPFIMEFTPSCDYVQGKVQLPRFIGGLLIPWTTGGRREKAHFVKEIGPVFLPSVGTVPEGIYGLSFNCHFICGIKVVFSKRLKPNLRIRQVLLSDVVAWATSEMARPGYSFLSALR